MSFVQKFIQNVSQNVFFHGSSETQNVKQLAECPQQILANSKHIR